MNQNTKFSKINWWMVATLILLGVIVGFGVSQVPYFKNITKNTQTDSVSQPESDSTQPSQQASQEPVLTPEQISQLSDDDPFFGDENAPITVVEFTDFQCPYCARFAKLSFPKIDENYIKTGKVKFVIRDFPLDFHAQSQLVSEAAECADEQGKFREMHDMIFDEQTAWSGDEKAADLMKSYAQRLGLNMTQFNSCLSGNKYAAEVRKDLIDGASMGVNGTPAFFINGKPVSGAMPYELIFKPIFDAVLEGKQWEIQYDATGVPSVKVF